jgi:hypothetical protein
MEIRKQCVCGMRLCAARIVVVSLEFYVPVRCSPSGPLLDDRAAMGTMPGS